MATIVSVKRVIAARRRGRIITEGYTSSHSDREKKVAKPCKKYQAAIFTVRN
jgi:hypothetical protein